jgi:hypothetical protein
MKKKVRQNSLIIWSCVLLEKLTVAKLGKRIQNNMEPEGSLPCS